MPSAPGARSAQPSKRPVKPLLKRSPESSGSGTEPRECVGSQFATLGVVFDAVFDSLLPILPAATRAQAPSIKARAHRDLRAARVSTLSVSSHPSDLGADEDDPISTYRDPISQWIVTQLINVREGRDGQVIRAEDLTLSQAVETVWLYLYVTVMVPLTIVRRSIPSIAPLAGPISVGTIVTLPILIGVFASTQIYKALSNSLVDACVVSVTRSEKERAGKSIKDLRFAGQTPQIVRDIASQVLVADADSCRPIGSLPLSRIVSRTSTYLKAVSKNPATDQQITDMTGRLQAFMKQARVHPNLIPADPADFTAVETVLSLGLTFVPYISGAPTDIIIGLNKNRYEGADFGKTIPLGSLSVTKSLTAAYYAYALTAHIIELAWSNAGVDPAASLANELFPGLGITADMIPRSSGIVSAPNLYGLVVFHNVLRSLCLQEDSHPERARGTDARSRNQANATKVSGTPAGRVRW
ncbi:hypothetical protein GS4_08_00810 [Gordonia soli NBRC 108243]|uniref:Uncharacterized protein n=1 Tax=Gordonia soli NBRC 108243 TaxID=1223545 RepID=M0QJ96_9ACTN|nr:hypothetical protein GS4_08_00810 [Gordonia soli NBRC 108243]